MKRRDHVQPLRRIYADHPIESHIAATLFDFFGAARADDQRNQRFEKAVTLSIAGQRVVPRHHERCDDWAGALRCIAPWLAGHVGHSFHDAGIERVVLAVATGLEADRLDLSKALGIYCCFHDLTPLGLKTERLSEAAGLPSPLFVLHSIGRLVRGTALRRHRSV
ncbi:hypothetical protein D9M73_90690 [compost metagenome]